MHPTYRPEIDGLRALAVVSVLIFHLNPVWLSGGFIGVDIFFVISGFLITNIIRTKLLKNEFSFSEFYARRAKRIFPALFIVLIISSLFAYISLPPEEFKSFFKDLRYVLLQFGNVHFSNDLDYFSQGLAASPLLHTWSLGVEEQFYLLWPLLLFISFKWLSPALRAPVFLACLIGSIALSEALLTIDAKQAYYMVYSRGWELLLGGILVFGKLPEITRKRTADITSVLTLGIIVGCLLIYSESDFPGLKALLPVAATALFIHSATHYKGIGHQLLCIKPALTIGLYSYSLYLWHWPLIAFTKTLTENALTLQAIVIITLVCFVLAGLTYRFIEQPFLKTTANTRKVLISSFCFIVFGVVASNTLKHFDYHPSRSAYAYDLNESLAINTQALCKKDFKATCTPYADGRYDLLLAGDSHGAHYAPLILHWAKRYNYRVKIITQGGCPTWLRENTVRESTVRESTVREKTVREARDSDTCLAKKQAFTTVLSKIKRRVFLAIKADQLASDYGVTQDYPFNGLINPALEGQSVTLLLQVPLLNQNPNSCLFKQNSRLNALINFKNKHEKSCIDTLKSQNMSGSNLLLEQLAREQKWQTYTPEPLNTHFVNDAGKLLYKDSNHLNIYGNLFLLEHFISRVKPQAL